MNTITKKNTIALTLFLMSTSVFAWSLPFTSSTDRTLTPKAAANEMIEVANKMAHRSNKLLTRSKLHSEDIIAEAKVRALSIISDAKNKPQDVKEHAKTQAKDIMVILSNSTKDTMAHTRDLLKSYADNASSQIEIIMEASANNMAKVSSDMSDKVSNATNAVNTSAEALINGKSDVEVN
jgi:exonuclease VII large subunit